MPPSYALLPASSYPKTIRGMCYAIVSQLDSDKILTSCHAYHMEIRCVKHSTIWLVSPTARHVWCKLKVTANHSKAYNGYPWISTNQKVANHRPGRLGKLSQHAVAQS